MNKKYRVELSRQERERLKELISAGSLSCRANRHARILLKADAGPGGPRWSDEQVSEALEISVRSVMRVRQAYVQAGLERAVWRQKSRLVRAHKIDGEVEAHLVALVCSPPPSGRARWSLRLLGERLLELVDLESVSYETVRRALKKNELKPWLKQQWCLPGGADAGFVAQMEEVLDLYQQPPDPHCPLVCLDESHKEQRKEVRLAEPLGPNKPYRFDHQYEHNGRSSLFMLFAPHLNWRHVKVSEQRTALDLAECLRELVDVHFPQAGRIRLVLDNLNPHSKASLYAHFPPAEAHRIASRLEFHYTPKHGSWLNMAEIELSVLGRQCLDQRIPDQPTLIQAVAAWEDARNQAHATVRWQFTSADARTKLEHLYPCLQYASYPVTHY